jgi:hypothetical protein
VLFWSVDLDVFSVESESCVIEIEVGLHLILDILSFEEWYQLDVVEVLPVMRAVDDVVRSLLLQVVKHWYIFTLEKSKGLSEVEVG